MAISWDTYYALPHLKNYIEAKEHYDRVIPIRGDENKTRPAGRRDQKWCSIWQTEDKSIVIGYGSGELKQRKPFISFQPSGTITLHNFGRFSSASTNERMQRILGTAVQTHQYDTWVQCSWYDNGVRRKGYLPLHRNHKADWHDKEGKSSVFVREKDGELVYLNYVYPVTHKLNRPAINVALEPAKPFLNWVSAMIKLQGTGRLEFTAETQAEYFGWSNWKDWRGVEQPNNPPSILGWARDRDENRARFTQWVQGDSVDDWMRAALTLQYYHDANNPRDCLIDMAIKDDPDNLLIAQVHTWGHKVTDRYKKYLRP